MPRSRPIPDSLNPPNGAFGWGTMLFNATLPDSRRRAMR